MSEAVGTGDPAAVTVTMTSNEPVMLGASQTVLVAASAAAVMLIASVSSLSVVESDATQAVDCVCLRQGRG